MSATSPFAVLGQVLSQTPSLRALRILVAESTGERSPWTRAFLHRPDGIPVGNVLKSALAYVNSLRYLTIIQLDAFSDIAPLLRIAPNLESLHMRLPSGYAQYINPELVSALRNVPNLRELKYSAGSLHVYTLSRDRDMNIFMNEAEDVNLRDESGSAELVAAFGKILPRLESLDLQSRWYGDEILFPMHLEHILPDVSYSLSEQ